MRKPGYLPPELGHVFSVQEAAQLHVSEKRLRTPDLRTPFHGARSVAVDEPTDRYELEHHRLQLRCQAYASIAPAGAAFSHVTAAQLYGMPLPARVRTREVLDVSYIGAHVRRAGVIGHRVKDVMVRSVDGLSVVPPELAWIQLAPLLGVDELVIAGDYLVRRKLPASTMHRLRSAMIAHTGARGMKTARTAYEMVRTRTDSAKESEVRLLIVRSGLPEPAVNKEITVNGEWLGTPDLSYPEWKIAIEYQGAHHRERATYNEDITRREMFEAAGWKVILVTSDQLQHPQHLIARIRDAIRAASR